MFNKIITFSSDFFILLLIFSFFNDNYIVNLFGDNALKILIVIFYLFYFPSMYQNLKSLNTTQFKLIFIFIGYLFFSLLTEMFLEWKYLDFYPSGSSLIAIFGMLLYFSRYSVNKLLYFIWFSMMYSIVLCYINQPLDEYTFRKSGGTEDPNEFAAQLLAFLFASIYLYTRNKSNLFMAVTLLFFTYGLFKAGSMSSFLVLGIIVSISLIRLMIIKPNYFFNLKALILLVVLLIASTQFDFKKIEDIQNILNRTKNTGTALFRMHSWIAGKHMVEDNPFFGVGQDTFGNYEPIYEEFHMVGSAPAPHNIYVKLMAESGIPTFLLFMLFLVHIVTINIKVLFYNNEWFLLASLLSMLLMGMTLGMLYDKHPWLFIIILMNLNHQLKKKGYIS